MNQRRKDSNLLAGKVFENAMDYALFGFRSNSETTVRTILYTEFYKEKADVMIELGDCGYCALETSAAASLLDRHSGRYTGDTVYIGPRSRLDELPCVGVQGF